MPGAVLAEPGTSSWPAVAAARPTRQNASNQPTSTRPPGWNGPSNVAEM